MRHSTLVILFSCAALFLSGTARAQTPIYTYRVVNEFPHDTAAFTEGLELDRGALYESTGLYGSSTLRQVDLATGVVLRQVAVPSQYFAEGMTVFRGQLFQLTWQSQTGFIYDPATLTKVGQFSYAGEGWGLTHDDQHLIMSDGTNQIRFIDPVTFNTVRTIAVNDEQGAALTNINELEFINGEIYANVWLTNWVIRIDPASGRLLGRIDFTGLLPAGTSADVLNGIAYDAATGHLLVTGKLWPTLFEVEIVGNAAPVATNQAVTTQEDVARSITLTATDLDGDPLSFTIVSGPSHGALSGTLPLLTYAPSANFNGPDAFTFFATDGISTSNVATVSVTVMPVNDPPVATKDAFVVSLNGVFSAPSPGVLANDNDVDGDPLTAVVVSGPAHGALTLNPNGGFTYTPALNFSGTDAFSYVARDATLASAPATVSLSVTAPTMSVSPGSISFGNQAVGMSSASSSITVVNNGTMTVSFASISVTGANAADFAQTNTCGGSLAAGRSCAIAVVFKPTATGTRKAAVTITSNAAGSPVNVTLGGNGKKAGR